MFASRMGYKKGQLLRLAPGDNPLTQVTVTTQATAGAQTITAAALTGGFYARTITAVATDTTATAAQILAANPEMSVGDTFVCIISNRASTAILTIAGGTGVTLTGTAAIAAAATAFLVITKTSETTVAAFLA